MKRFILAVLAGAALCLNSTPSAAAQASAPAAAPSAEQLELARQVIDATGLRKTLEPQVRAMLAQFPNPNLSKEGQAAQEELVSRLPAVIDAVTVVYAQVYSEDELRGILSFYKSQAGKAMIAKSPQLTQAMVPAMMQALFAGG